MGVGSEKQGTPSAWSRCIFRFFWLVPSWKWGQKLGKLSVINRVPAICGDRCGVIVWLPGLSLQTGLPPHSPAWGPGFPAGLLQIAPRFPGGVRQRAVSPRALCTQSHFETTPCNKPPQNVPAPPPRGAPVPCAYVQVRTGAHTYRTALASTAAPACLATERGRRERRAHTGGDPSDVLGRQRAIPVSSHESSRTPVWARDTFLSPGLLSF